MKVNYLGIVCIALAVVCGSCEDKQAQEKIAQLEKDKAQLEVQKAKLEKANKEANQVKHNFDDLASMSNNHHPSYIRPRLSQPKWEKYGNVELWTFSKINPFDGGYQLKRTGEGTVYVRHSENGDKYELRYSSDGRNYSYPVSRGNFTVETDDVVMQFNAHAGSHYFDI